MRWRTRTGDAIAGAGTKPSFAEVVLPNLDAAYNLARWLVRDPAQAEDVVQDAVLRGLTYFASYRGGDPRAWLLRIVRNTAHSTLADRRRPLGDGGAGEGLDGDDVLNVADPGPDPETTLSGLQSGRRLAEAIAGLPPELRECLILKELDELSYKEIAQVTGVPIGTVMSRLWRARRMLAGSATEGAERER